MNNINYITTKVEKVALLLVTISDYNDIENKPVDSFINNIKQFNDQVNESVAKFGGILINNIGETILAGWFLRKEDDPKLMQKMLYQICGTAVSIMEQIKSKYPYLNRVIISLTFGEAIFSLKDNKYSLISCKESEKLESIVKNCIEQRNIILADKSIVDNCREFQFKEKQTNVYEVIQLEDFTMKNIKYDSFFPHVMEKGLLWKIKEIFKKLYMRLKGR